MTGYPVKAYGGGLWEGRYQAFPVPLPEAKKAFLCALNLARPLEKVGNTPKRALPLARR